MNNNPLMNMMMQRLQNNPNIMNNPQAKSFLEVLQSGDEEKGRQIAENLCKTYGVTPEQAVQQAKQFFGNMR